jgi:hypothetical protein
VSPLQSDAAAYAEFRDGLGLDKPLYSRDDLKSLFKKSERTVDRIIMSGQLRVIDVHGSVMAARGDVARYLFEQRRSDRRKPVTARAPRSPGRPRTNPRLKAEPPDQE